MRSSMGVHSISHLWVVLVRCCWFHPNASYSTGAEPAQAVPRSRLNAMQLAHLLLYSWGEENGGEACMRSVMQLEKRRACAVECGRRTRDIAPTMRCFASKRKRTFHLVVFNSPPYPFYMRPTETRSMSTQMDR